MRHVEAYTVIVRQFPIDLPRSEQSEEPGIGQKLSVLEQAGLVHASGTTTVANRLLDPLRGCTPATTRKRYELTADGKKYFRQILGTLGQTSGFCYGQMRVDSMVKWTEPVTVGTVSQTEVMYTYKIVEAAAWAERPDVQQAFSDSRTSINGASKRTEVAGLQLTNKGWEVPGQ